MGCVGPKGCGTIRAVTFGRISVSRSRWALWLFAAALLLKAAMPMLASASAQVQGKTVVEICTVYGVSLVALDAQDPAPAPADHAADHTGHCTLTALTALAAADPALLAVLFDVPAPPAAAPPAERSPREPDPSARWVARLHHAPPARA